MLMLGKEKEDLGASASGEALEAVADALKAIVRLEQQLTRRSSVASVFFKSWPAVTSQYHRKDQQQMHQMDRARCQYQSSASAARRARRVQQQQRSSKAKGQRCAARSSQRASSRWSHVLLLALLVLWCRWQCYGLLRAAVEGTSNSGSQAPFRLQQSETLSTIYRYITGTVLVVLAQY
jgi:hypothetical protein